MPNVREEAFYGGPGLQIGEELCERPFRLNHKIWCFDLFVGQAEFAISIHHDAIAARPVGVNGLEEPMVEYVVYFRLDREMTVCPDCQHATGSKYSFGLTVELFLIEPMRGLRDCDQVKGRIGEWCVFGGRYKVMELGMRNAIF